MPLTVTSFGVECEFAEGALDVAQALVAQARFSTADRILCATDRLHDYHCRCESCQYVLPGQRGVSYTWRFQRDSSCSGEAISKPFMDWTEARLAFDALQYHAVEVDATPGMAAGFHVHVARPDTSFETWLVPFMRYEPVWEILTVGRFADPRGNNASLRNALGEGVMSVLGMRRRTTPDGRNYVPVSETLLPQHWERIFGRGAVHHLVERYSQLDRHNYLNSRTRYNTIEVRLFNSTRTAWRMELFARLAVAILHDFPQHLPPLWITPDTVANGIQAVQTAAAAIDDRLAELLDRQITYLSKVFSGELVVPDLSGVA